MGEKTDKYFPLSIIISGGGEKFFVRTYIARIYKFTVHLDSNK